MKCNNIKYKRITIKGLFNSLEEIMARTPEITMDSEVIISDINMGVFKNELRVYPTYDYKDRKVKVGIYLNPYEKDEILEEEPIKETHTQIKSIVGTKEEPTQELAWLNKYRR